MAGSSDATEPGGSASVEFGSVEDRERLRRAEQIASEAYERAINEARAAQERHGRAVSGASALLTASTAASDAGREFALAHSVADTDASGRSIRAGYDYSISSASAAAESTVGRRGVEGIVGNATAAGSAAASAHSSASSSAVRTTSASAAHPRTATTSSVDTSAVLAPSVSPLAFDGGHGDSIGADRAERDSPPLPPTTASWDASRLSDAASSMLPRELTAGSSTVRSSNESQASLIMQLDRELSGTVRNLQQDRARQAHVIDSLRAELAAALRQREEALRMLKEASAKPASSGPTALQAAEVAARADYYKQALDTQTRAVLDAEQRSKAAAEEAAAARAEAIAATERATAGEAAAAEAKARLVPIAERADALAEQVVNQARELETLRSRLADRDTGAEVEVATLRARLEDAQRGAQSVADSKRALTDVVGELKDRVQRLERDVEDAQSSVRRANTERDSSAKDAAAARAAARDAIEAARGIEVQATARVTQLEARLREAEERATVARNEARSAIARAEEAEVRGHRVAATARAAVAEAESAAVARSAAAVAASTTLSSSSQHGHEVASSTAAPQSDVASASASVLSERLDEISSERDTLLRQLSSLGATVAAQQAQLAALLASRDPSGAGSHASSHPVTRESVASARGAKPLAAGLLEAAEAEAHLTLRAPEYASSGQVAVGESTPAGDTTPGAERAERGARNDRGARRRRHERGSHSDRERRRSHSRSREHGRRSRDRGRGHAHRRSHRSHSRRRARTRSLSRRHSSRRNSGHSADDPRERVPRRRRLSSQSLTMSASFSESSYTRSSSGELLTSSTGSTIHSSDERSSSSSPGDRPSRGGGRRGPDIAAERGDAAHSSRPDSGSWGDTARNAPQRDQAPATAATIAELQRLIQRKAAAEAALRAAGVPVSGDADDMGPPAPPSTPLIYQSSTDISAALQRIESLAALQPPFSNPTSPTPFEGASASAPARGSPRTPERRARSATAGSGFAVSSSVGGSGQPPPAYARPAASPAASPRRSTIAPASPKAKREEPAGEPSNLNAAQGPSPPAPQHAQPERAAVAPETVTLHVSPALMERHRRGEGGNVKPGPAPPLPPAAAKPRRGKRTRKVAASKATRPQPAGRPPRASAPRSVRSLGSAEQRMRQRVERAGSSAAKGGGADRKAPRRRAPLQRRAAAGVATAAAKRGERVASKRAPATPTRTSPRLLSSSGRKKATAGRARKQKPQQQQQPAVSLADEYVRMMETSDKQTDRPDVPAFMFKPDSGGDAGPADEATSHGADPVAPAVYYPDEHGARRAAQDDEQGQDAADSAGRERTDPPPSWNVGGTKFGTEDGLYWSSGRSGGRAVAEVDASFNGGDADADGDGDGDDGNGDGEKRSSDEDAGDDDADFYEQGGTKAVDGADDDAVVLSASVASGASTSSHQGPLRYKIPGSDGGASDNGSADGSASGSHAGVTSIWFPKDVSALAPPRAVTTAAPVREAKRRSSDETEGSKGLGDNVDEAATASVAASATAASTSEATGGSPGRGVHEQLHAFRDAYAMAVSQPLFPTTSSVDSRGRTTIIVGKADHPPARNGRGGGSEESSPARRPIPEVLSMSGRSAGSSVEGRGEVSFTMRDGVLFAPRPQGEPPTPPPEGEAEASAGKLGESEAQRRAKSLRLARTAVGHVRPGGPKGRTVRETHPVVRQSATRGGGRAPPVRRSPTKRVPRPHVPHASGAAKGATGARGRRAPSSSTTSASSWATSASRAAAPPSSRAVASRAAPSSPSHTLPGRRLATAGNGKAERDEATLAHWRW